MRNMSNEAHFVFFYVSRDLAHTPVTSVGHWSTHKATNPGDGGAELSRIYYEKCQEDGDFPAVGEAGEFGIAYLANGDSLVVTCSEWVNGVATRNPEQWRPYLAARSYDNEGCRGKSIRVPPAEWSMIVDKDGAWHPPNILMEDAVKRTKAYQDASSPPIPPEGTELTEDEARKLGDLYRAAETELKTGDRPPSLGWDETASWVWYFGCDYWPFGSDEEVAGQYSFKERHKAAALLNSYCEKLQEPVSLSYEECKRTENLRDTHIRSYWADRRPGVSYHITIPLVCTAKDTHPPTPQVVEWDVPLTGPDISFGEGGHYKITQVTAGDLASSAAEANCVVRLEFAGPPMHRVTELTIGQFKGMSGDARDVVVSTNGNAVCHVKYNAILDDKYPDLLIRVSNMI